MLLQKAFSFFKDTTFKFRNSLKDGLKIRFGARAFQSSDCTWKAIENLQKGLDLNVRACHLGANDEQNSIQFFISFHTEQYNFNFNC